MNKYLEKIAGKPISGENLRQVAKSVISSGMNFVNGPKDTRSMLKLTTSNARFNKNLPKHLGEEFEKLQLEEANKYISKISSDLSLAEKSEDEEEKAIHDYGQREKEVKDPALKKDYGWIKKDEEEHRHAFAMIRQKLRE